MKFVADENVDAPIINLLREQGHIVYSIAENEPGMPDDVVLRTAYEKECLLITLDKDFGELVYRLGKAHHGVILVRLPGLNPFVKAELCVGVLKTHAKELPGAFTVIYKEYVKIRKNQ